MIFYCEGIFIEKITTRTYSMARYRKTPRSRRNLMVFDPLTQFQGYQFDPRVKISVYTGLSGLLLIPVNLMSHDHVQKIKFLTTALSSP